METVINPGSTIGLLGGGQLGRMFAIAARRMGYRVHTFEPYRDSPAGQISDREFNASFTDENLLTQFVDSVDVITFEFENIPAGVVNRIAQRKPVHPRAEVLHVCQNREREKTFLRKRGYPHTPFAIVSSQAELDSAIRLIGTPCVLKTTDFGYDGKGQNKIEAGGCGRFAQLGADRAVLEKWLPLELELSVVCARNIHGEIRCFPAAENLHVHQILDHSIAPGRIASEVALAARSIAESIAEDLEVVGLIAVEYFLTREGDLLVNELAPRPHNSGHYTFDACVTSQFEQQLRAVCGLPFGSPELLRPVVMVNLLGDLWNAAHAPDWNAILRNPRAKLHLYGKTEPRPGRKMGHYCVLGESVEIALSEALSIKALLNPR